MSNATLTRPETLTIVLTDARPIEVSKADWSLVAKAKDWDNTYEFQADRTWTMRVRQHDDGRCVVYGIHTTACSAGRDRRGGEMVDTIEDVPAAIRRVVRYLDFPAYLVDECVGNLPAVEIA
jgi:hypothetical protein